MAKKKRFRGETKKDEEMQARIRRRAKFQERMISCQCECFLYKTAWFRPAVLLYVILVV